MGHHHPASDAWQAFQAELTCVDEEHQKRAFVCAWCTRGLADKAAAKAKVFQRDDRAKLLKRLDELDEPPWY